MSVPKITGVQLSEPSAGPLLLLGNSIGTSATALWAASAAVLGERFHVVAWDLPGHGRNTDPVSDSFSMAELAAGVMAFADRVLTVFNNSAQFSSAWRIPKVSDVLTNYFWTHWIYLGAIWGTITLIGISLWLRVLGTTSILYCWAVWAILGQASGSYVGPKTWAVLLIAAACTVLVSQQEASEERVYAGPQLHPLLARRFPRLAGPT